ncbi:hypothetical protein AC578_4970, partial [Pseudocercospora eumusae]
MQRFNRLLVQLKKRERLIFLLRIKNLRVCTYIYAGIDVSNNLRSYVKSYYLRDGYTLRDTKRGRKIAED